MTTAYDFDFVGIKGDSLPLRQFEGQALLVVNVASRCGFTPQYSRLQKLYDDYRARGLVVIGVPCNQFLWQEPAGEAEIASFCQLNYAITFPMTAKTQVKGSGAHPFFVWMSERLGRGAVPAWNFHKLLTDRSGAPVAAFKSAIDPDSADMRSAVERVL